jgi:hypothetical protein
LNLLFFKTLGYCLWVIKPTEGNVKMDVNTTNSVLGDDPNNWMFPSWVTPAIISGAVTVAFATAAAAWRYWNGAWCPRRSAAEEAGTEMTDRRNALILGASATAPLLGDQNNGVGTAQDEALAGSAASYAPQ